MSFSATRFWAKSTALNLVAASCCLANFSNVTAAWVYGSAQAGIVNPGSDVDIAILFADPPSLYDLAEIREALQQALNFDEVDLLALNNAGTIVRFEAVSGRLLSCRDRGRRAEFVSLAAREYENEMAFLRWGMAMVGQRKAE